MKRESPGYGGWLKIKGKGEKVLDRVRGIPRLWKAKGKRLGAVADRPSDASSLPYGQVNGNMLWDRTSGKTFCALAPVWREESEDCGHLVPLKEHIRRLSRVTHELAGYSSVEDWRVASEQLALAAYLRDLRADTDIEGDSTWCSSAAKFEAANSEVSAKYIAGTVVFGFVWAAYEAVTEASASIIPRKWPQGKGAKAREILKYLDRECQLPYLRKVIVGVALSPGSQLIDFREEMIKELLLAPSLAAFGAERLRRFRNALIHGDFRPPLASNWEGDGVGLRQEQPEIMQFHDNIRITLLLIQILIRSTLKGEDKLEGWLSEEVSGKVMLSQLHCRVAMSEWEELPFLDAPILAERE